MKVFKVFLVLLCAAPLLFYACKVDDPFETEEVIPPNGAISAFFKRHKTQSQFFTITPPNYYSVLGNRGARILFGYHPFITASGAPPTSDNIEIELKEVYSIKDMIFSGISTITGNGEVLISGGQLYLEARQNGQLLFINKNDDAFARIRTNFYTQPMQLFYGAMNGDSVITWTLANSDTLWPGFTDSLRIARNYSFDLDSLTWINLDIPAGGTTISVSVTTEKTFSPVNTAVFIVFPSLNSVAALTRYNDSTSTYTADLTFPAAIDVTFVAIAEQDSVMHYYENTVTINGDHTETVTLTPTTEAAIEAALDEL